METAEKRNEIYKLFKWSTNIRKRNASNSFIDLLKMYEMSETATQFRNTYFTENIHINASKIVPNVLNGEWANVMKTFAKVHPYVCVCLLARKHTKSKWIFRLTPDKVQQRVSRNLWQWFCKMCIVFYRLVEHTFLPELNRRKPINSNNNGPRRKFLPHLFFFSQLFAPHVSRAKL